MPPASAYPKLRDEIDAAPLRHEDQELYVLHDQTGLAPERLAVSGPVLWLAARLDGNSSLLEIHDRFRREAGDEAPSLAELAAVVEALDAAFFLEGPRFDDFLAQTRRDFDALAWLPPASAGGAYPDDPGELAKELDRILADAPPDESPEPDALNASNASAAHGRRAPRGVIAPHIDYARGQAGYGQLYRALAARRAPRVVVVLGTAHRPLSTVAAVCDKDFAVPGAVLARDAGRVGELLRAGEALGADWAADAFAHRGEHSVELQAVWLAHIWPGVQIVPVLVAAPPVADIDADDDVGVDVGDGQKDAGQKKSRRQGGDGDDGHDGGDGEKENEKDGDGGVDDNDEVQRQALGRVLGRWIERPGEVMLLASADLAHIGPRFGDARPVSEPFLSEVEAGDRDFLAAVAAGGSREALRRAAAAGNPRRLCGLGPIDALGRALGAAPGRLLGYHQAATPELEQAVTFGVVVFD